MPISSKKQRSSSGNWQSGQTIVEYILVAALLIIALILAFKAGQVDEAMKTAADNIENGVTVE